MKVAVLSDIHGNFQALKAVVNDMDKFDCEKVLCLGDLAMAGPQPDVVINYVEKQNDWEVIQGNTDKMIAEYSIELFNQVYSTFPVMANALADDAKILSDAQKNFLKNLPQQKDIDICGVKVLMVHGSPRKNNEDILLEEIIHLLVDSGKSIYEKTNKGETPLHIACKQNWYNGVNKLMKIKTIDIQIHDNNKHTPYQLTTDDKIKSLFNLS